MVEGLQKMVLTMESRLNQMEKGGNTSTTSSKPAPTHATAADSDDGVDLFDRYADSKIV